MGASSRFVRGTTAAGMVAVVVLGWALLRASRWLVAPAIVLLALAAMGGNGSSLTLVPVESATLVAIALLGWWSIDEQHAAVREPGVDRHRSLTSASLVLAGAGLSVLVVTMATVASTGLVGPAVGAVGLGSVAAALWSTARLRRYEAEQSR